MDDSAPESLRLKQLSNELNIDAREVLLSFAMALASSQKLPQDVYLSPAGNETWATSTPTSEGVIYHELLRTGEGELIDRATDFTLAYLLKCKELSL